MLSSIVVLAVATGAVCLAAPVHNVARSVQNVRESLQAVTREARIPCHIEGVVTFPPEQDGDDFFYVEDATGGVLVHPSKHVALVIGDRVAVDGSMYVSKNADVELDAANITIVSSGPRPKPKEVSLNDALSGRYLGQLIRITAPVAEVIRKEEFEFAFLGPSAHFRTTLHRRPSETFILRQIAAGSLVQATGICAAYPMEHSFQLRLRDVNDLAIVQRAPILTPGRFRWAMEAAMVLAIFAMVWIYLLNGAVRKSDQQYRLLFAASPKPMWVYDQESLKFLAVNQSAIVQYGYTEEEFLSKTMDDIRPPEDIEALHSAREAAESDRKPSGPWRHLKKDGTPIWVEVRTHPIAFKGRKARITLVNDITERKRAEEALRSRERELNALLESVPDGISCYDRDLRHVFVNRSVELGRGLRGEEFIGKTDRELGVPEELCALWEQQLRQIFEGGHHTSAEFSFHGPRGERILHAHGAPCVGTDGTVERVLVITRDITHRKHLEEQLRHSQKMEAVGRLAGGVAHDFNNLLTIIQGYSHVLLGELEEKNPLRNHVGEVLQAAERASALTNQLLAFSRKQVLQPRILDLNEIVACTEAMLRRLIGEDIDLLMLLDEEAGNVRADPGQIEQVIINLAVNARDAMPDGGKIIIETQFTSVAVPRPATGSSIPAGNYATLSVTDTGHGMDAATRARIFEPFFTTKGYGKGTGLGLATVYGIVEQSGGHMVVESEVGQGASFIIFLPQLLDSPDAPPQRDLDVLPAGARATILLVEDEHSLRELLREVLSRNGYDVIEAADGVEALAKALRFLESIELVVTDVIMPRMNGPQFVNQLFPLRPDLRVIYMSGYTDAALTEMAGTPMVLLQKPFSPEALLHHIRKVMDANSGAEGLQVDAPVDGV